MQNPVGKGIRRQSNILIVSFQEKSLREYPNPDAGKIFDYRDEIEKAERAKENRMYARFTGDTLNYGLQRLPARASPDKY